jgi:hypothetical protein
MAHYLRRSRIGFCLDRPARCVSGFRAVVCLHDGVHGFVHGFVHGCVHHGCVHGCIHGWVHGGAWPSRPHHDLR